MNIADKMDREARLMTNLADWIGKHGNVLSGSAAFVSEDAAAAFAAAQKEKRDSAKEAEE